MILWIVETLPEIDEEWGLMVGDAIHNIRCALDHLWWQLAIDHLDRRLRRKRRGTSCSRSSPI
jgi:hypothetical protein